MTEWNPKIIKSITEFDNNILEYVNEGKYPALIIKNFYKNQTCEKIISKITHFSKYYHGDKFLKKIGIFVSAYVNRKEEYFKDAKKSNQEIDNIFDARNHMKKISKIINKMSKIQKIDHASEHNNDYSKGIIRIWENGDSGALHRDNANFDVPDFKISRHQNQLSCVLYLQSPLVGGELLIYKKHWQRSDEKFRDIEFGYKSDVVKDIESTKIFPQQGDLIIFNPKFFHEILSTQDKNPRITFGFFLGYSENNSIAETWS